jgi:hypothetical protein
MHGCIVLVVFFVLLCRKTLAVHMDILRIAIIPSIHKVKKRRKNDYSSKLDNPIIMNKIILQKILVYNLIRIVLFIFIIFIFLTMRTVFILNFYRIFKDSFVILYQYHFLTTITDIMPVS